MTVKGIIGFRGMKPAGNELALAPGSLVDAVDCVIPSKDVLMPRRGQKLTTYIDNDSSDANSNRAKQLYQWGTHLLVHYSGGAGDKLAIWKAWATSPSYALLGSFSEPDSTVLRMKFAELVRSLYFTTSAGLYTMALSTDTPRKAGLIAPLLVLSDEDGGIGTRLSGNPSASGSWFAKDQTVAGRTVVGKKDGNNRIVESGPSGRAVVANPKDVTVTIGNIARVGTTVTATINTGGASSASHKFRAGDVFALSPGEANFAAGNYTLTSVTATTLVWTNAGAAVASTVQQTLSSGTKSIQWTTYLNSDVAAGDFVRVYRTDESTGEASDPGDECFLSYERMLTSTDISNGYVIVTDTTPSSFLAAPLDTNASRDGVKLGFSERPPLMRDVCRWDGRLWGLETTDRHRLTLRLLGTGSPNGLQNGDIVCVNARAFRAYTGGGTGEFRAFDSQLPTENVDKTTWVFAAAIWGARAAAGIHAFQRFDGETGLGEVLIEQVDLGSTMADGSSGAINAIYAATSRTSAFGDPLAATKAVTTGVTTHRVGSTVTINAAGHGFVQGQVIMMANVQGLGDANFPAGLKTVASIVDANNFTYTEAGTAANLTGGTLYYAYATTFKSDNNRQLLRFSKQGIPEAWPLPNFPDGFPDGAEGLRIEPLVSGGGILVALKNGGFFTVSGQYPYVVSLLDDTADLVAPDSLKRHGGTLYALTTQGECRISESGIGIVGGDVEDITRLIAARVADGSVSQAVPFGVSYESDRQYQLYAPKETSAGSGTVGATVQQALVVNNPIGQEPCFTRWSVTRTCGLVWKGGDYLVLGDASSNQLRVERKTLTYADFVDEQATLTVSGDQPNTNQITITASAFAGALTAGDAVVISGQRYLVTTSDSGTVQIDGTVSVTNGQTFIAYRRFSPTFTWAADVRGGPGIENRWKQVQLHFKERHFSRSTLTYKGEKSDNTGDVAVSDSVFAYGTPIRRLSTLRAKVHDNLEAVAQQQIKLTLSEAFGYFKILGYSGSSEPITERTGQ